MCVAAPDSAFHVPAREVNGPYAPEWHIPSRRPGMPIREGGPLIFFLIEGHSRAYLSQEGAPRSGPTRGYFYNGVNLKKNSFFKSVLKIFKVFFKAFLRF